MRFRPVLVNMLFLFPLLALYAFFLFRIMIMPLEDLGRHILNGKYIVAGQTEVLYKNVYSYTHPDYPFLNHHWLSGVIFYVVDSVFSLPGLYVLHTIICLGMLFITFQQMQQRSSRVIALFFGFFAILLLSTRISIRPESFGYLFLATLSFWAHKKWNQSEVGWRDIFFIFFIQLLWVNLHISFVLGLFVIGTLLLFKVVFIFKEKTRVFAKMKPFVFVAVAAVAGSCMNPSGIRGAIYPFMMFSNYGYSIVENQTPLFLLDKIYEPAFPFFFFFVVLTLVFLFFRAFFWKRFPIDWPEFVRVVISLGMAWMSLRHIPVFTILAFPFFAESFSFITQLFPNTEQKESMRLFARVAVVVMIIMGSLWIFSGTYSKKFTKEFLGWNYDSSQYAGVNFFRALQVQGNIFNNFDIGGHLDATLYPTHRVFVDNRPDAFPADFLRNEYIAMQVDESLWKRQLEKYNFHAIIFAPTDMTPWGITFMNARLRDPDWAVVYVDDYTLIFLRRLPEYAQAISQYEKRD